jgi:L-threonylcarbamoyladenylate synthase
MSSRLALKQIARRLHAGAVVGYPTEAVFGLGCDPWNEAAFYRLLALKQRPDSKGVILIAADETQLRPFLGSIAPKIAAQLRASWPGPVTWLVPAAPQVPHWLTGGRDTIAVRVTAHAPAADLCRAFGGALVSTSANRSGRAPARTALRTRLLFGPELDAVLTGSVGGLARPTAIYDARTGAVIRRG